MKKLHRSAKSGKFVDKAETEKNPDTTVTETSREGSQLAAIEEVRGRLKAGYDHASLPFKDNALMQCFRDLELLLYILTGAKTR